MAWHLFNAKPLHELMITQFSDQTRQKILSFYRTEEGFWPDFADIKHDYAQEFYQSYSSSISKCPRTG